jgi:hypothetical protein
MKNYSGMIMIIDLARDRHENFSWRVNLGMIMITYPGAFFMV